MNKNSKNPFMMRCSNITFNLREELHHLCALQSVFSLPGLQLVLAWWTLKPASFLSLYAYVHTQGLRLAVESKRDTQKYILYFLQA